MHYDPNETKLTQTGNKAVTGTESRQSDTRTSNLISKYDQFGWHWMPTVHHIVLTNQKQAHQCRKRSEVYDILYFEQSPLTPARLKLSCHRRTHLTDSVPTTSLPPPGDPSPSLWSFAVCHVCYRYCTIIHRGRILSVIERNPPVCRSVSRSVGRTPSSSFAYTEREHSHHIAPSYCWLESFRVRCCKGSRWSRRRPHNVPCVHLIATALDIPLCRLLILPFLTSPTSSSPFVCRMIIFHMRGISLCPFEQSVISFNPASIRGRNQHQPIFQRRFDVVGGRA